MHIFRLVPGPTTRSTMITLEISGDQGIFRSSNSNLSQTGKYIIQVAAQLIHTSVDRESVVESN